jgi:hypothetical protein
LMKCVVIFASQREWLFQSALPDYLQQSLVDHSCYSRHTDEELYAHVNDLFMPNLQSRQSEQ